MGRELSSTAHSLSRAVTDRLLGDLRDGGFRPVAWGRFVGQASARSLQQATVRPGAVLELTALHAGLALFRLKRWQEGPGLRWIGCSWALAVTHLGLLEHRRRIGLADLLTLARANLPVLAPDNRALTATVAVGTDLLDGRVARRAGTTTPFGRSADPLADAAFWSWYVLRHDSGPLARVMVLGAWGTPVAATTLLSVARGRMVDPPRPRWPAGMVQGLLLFRALTRDRDSPTRGHLPTDRPGRVSRRCRRATSPGSPRVATLASRGTASR